MIVLDVKNVGHAFLEGIRLLDHSGVDQDSRNGPVRVMPCPVTTMYRNPTERVLLNSIRDANPFFHFMEALWMLGGRNDVAYMETILPSFAQFSDDGETFHGAYGYRWRYHFYEYDMDENAILEKRRIDQLYDIIKILKHNPLDRRAVLTMWDPALDLGLEGKDFPCNTHIYFSRPGGGALDMTVCCRSNDIIWGAYGANAVHMSMLQEVMAAGIGCEVGTYYQVSNNYHGYQKTLEPYKNLIGNTYRDPYNVLRPYPVVNTPISRWFGELTMFLDQPEAIGFKDPFFRKVAAPIRRAHQCYREDSKDRFKNAKMEVNLCAADDWRTACSAWLDRREENAKRSSENSTST